MSLLTINDLTSRKPLVIQTNYKLSTQLSDHPKLKKSKLFNIREPRIGKYVPRKST
jgi:hypothetical protein